MFWPLHSRMFGCKWCRSCFFFVLPPGNLYFTVCSCSLFLFLFFPLTAFALFPFHFESACGIVSINICLFPDVCPPCHRSLPQPRSPCHRCRRWPCQRCPQCQPCRAPRFHRFLPSSCLPCPRWRCRRCRQSLASRRWRCRRCRPCPSPACQQSPSSRHLPRPKQAM